MSSDAKATIFYTLAEIAKNNGKDSDRIWFIYKDSVYDVTDYLEHHPGGGDLVTEWAGKDCTKAFDDFGHSGDAKKDLKALKIGEVVEEERKKKPKKSEKEVNINNNGPKIIEASEKMTINRSCIHIITCGLCA